MSRYSKACDGSSRSCRHRTRDAEHGRGRGYGHGRGHGPGHGHDHPRGRASTHDSSGIRNTTLAPTNTTYSYQAYSDVHTGGVEGPSDAYKPHIPKLDATTLAQEGWTLAFDEQVLLEAGFTDITFVGEYKQPSK